MFKDKRYTREGQNGHLIPWVQVTRKCAGGSGTRSLSDLSNRNPQLLSFNTAITQHFFLGVSIMFDGVHLTTL